MLQAKKLSSATSLALIILWLSAPSGALAQQQKYLIDHGIEDCRKKDEPDNHSAFAYSTGQGYGCSWRYSTPEAARERALLECKKRLHQSLWQKARCKVIWEDGVITDPKTVAAERSDTRIPMTFEIFDGVSGKKEHVRGHMVTGKYSDPKKRPFSFTVGSGAEICSGNYRIQKSGQNAKVYADLRCFDEFSAKINGVPLNKFVKVGSRYVRYFEARFNYKGSYIQPRLR